MDNFNIRAYLAEGRLNEEEGVNSRKILATLEDKLKNHDFTYGNADGDRYTKGVGERKEINDLIKALGKSDEAIALYNRYAAKNNTTNGSDYTIKKDWIKETSTVTNEGKSAKELETHIAALSKARAQAASSGKTTLLNSLHRDISKAQKELKKLSTKVEEKRPDYPDVDNDGDTEESMEKALKDKETPTAVTEEDAEGTNFDYDYADIGQFYLEGLNKPFDLTEDELKDLGESIVRNIYKGDIKAAYDAIVHNKGLEHKVKYSEPNDTYQVWLADEIVTDFATKEKADAEAKRLNALQEAEIEVDDTTEFKIELKHLLDKHTVKEDYYPSLRAYNVIDGDGNIVYKKLPRHTAIEKAGEREDYKFTATDSLAEDLDIGHQDNEPGMLKAELYHIGSYAMELYKMMDALEGQGEVDFPAWWQSKITTAKTMISGAKHYLEFELKEPAIEDMVDDLTVSSVELQELTPNELAGETKDGPNAYEGKMSHSSNKVEELKKAVLAKLSGK